LEKFAYVALNKPIGVTCTLKDRFAEKKVTDLVPHSLGRLYPVGRLDRDSSGLVILTNDGGFSQRMSHPRYGAEKEYLVTVIPPVSRKEAALLKAGVIYEEEKLSASDVRILKTESGRSTLQIILKEGKKREIRRMFGSLGHHVATLERVRIGRIMLGNLAPGKWRFLTKEEVTV
jgi:pseudouridine synthase